jgi:hypothetical protein
MTVSDLIKRLVDFGPSAEVRINPSLNSSGDKVERVYGVEARTVHHEKVVFIVREAPEL